MSLCLALAASAAWGQSLFDTSGRRIDGNQRNDEESHFAEGNDSASEEKMPEGMYVWRVDNLFGDRTIEQPDTMAAGFQNSNLTDGPTGAYNMLGNMGSPRIARLFTPRPVQSDFIFTDPFLFFLGGPENFHFTNTFSPITNVTYHECGNRTDGEDRITARFAVNAGKRAGFGLKFDYLYGRGYYANQGTSEFNTTLYGSYISDKYELHALAQTNRIKMGENGGVEDDNFITNPERFPDKYNSTDIPTVMSKSWTRVYSDEAFLSQRYNVGFYRTLDADGKVVKNDKDTLLTDPVAIARLDSAALDSLARLAEEFARRKREFVPVASFGHVLRVEGNTHKYIDNAQRTGFYLNQFFDGDSVNDRTRYLKISNTLSAQVREGFSKWAKAGLGVFAKHELMKFRLPMDRTATKDYSENRLTLGARIVSTQSQYLKYTLIGSTSQTEGKFGQFNFDGDMHFSLPLKHDTIDLHVRALASRLRPSFYYRHYHGMHAWWDNDDLSDEMRTRIEGILAYSRTRTQLRVSVENVKDYVYLATSAMKYTGGKDSTLYSQGVGVKQKSGSVQVVEAALNQDFRFGIFNWENELTYALSSDKDVIPLPRFSVYSNLYLFFKIARVLSVRLGGDVRWFTEYYAPAYSPMVGQFAVQPDGDSRMKVGNYPVIDVYANCHLKHTRFYVMATHVNKSSNGGRYFLVPHYPINPLTIKFGISWNFFN